MENKLKVLFIEHDEYRSMYKSDIESAGAECLPIENPEKSVIEEAFNNHKFDLVITDAFFLPPGRDHIRHGKGQYKLDDIVEIIRGLDERIKIIVFTSFHEDLINNPKYKEIRNVDFIIDKTSISRPFFVWQIQRFLKDKIYKNFHDFALVNELLIKLNDEDLPWKKEMYEMLIKYRRGISEKEKIDTIKSNLKNIVHDLGIKSEFTEILNAIQNNEPFNIANNPTNFGHLRHVFNVFWLGYYILNSNQFDLSSLCNLNLEGDKEDVTKKLNSAWLLTSLLHDIGHIGEKFNSVINNLNGLTKIYPLEFEAASIKKLAIRQYDDYHNFLGAINGDSGTLIELFEEIIENETLDHGILSALTVYDKFKTKLEADILKLAVQAVGYHNILEKNPSKIKEITFNKYPLLNLLIFCDIIETWERNSGYESLYNDSALKSIELQSLNSTDKKINIIVNYRFYHEYYSSERLFQKELDGIIELVEKKVEQVLDSMVELPFFDIQFVTSNGKTILSWSNVD